MATRYKITAPVPHVVSTIAGVAFVESVGETSSPAALAYFRRHGYAVEAIPDPDAEPESTSDDDDPAGKRPKKSASKVDWVAFWVAQGMPEADAEALSRDQLAELTAVPTKSQEDEQ